MNILLVDDTKTDRLIMSTYLSQMGHTVTLGENGRQAVELYKEIQPDLLVMDVIMPEMDGYQATEQIRKAGHTLPIIAMSADETDETRALAFEAGMNEYLMKPARVESIKQLLIKHFSSTI